MSHFNLENKVYFSMQINETDLPANVNIFKEVVIIHGIGCPIPQMQLTLVDRHALLTGDLAINDGTRIQVSIGKTEQLARDIEFVVIGIKHYNENNGNGMIISCLLNVPNFYTEAGRDFTNGSSIDALSDLAGKAGLQQVTDLSTSDKMNWLNCGEPRHIYAQRITDHSYNGKQSAVKTVTSIYKELITQDMFEKLQEDPVATFLYSYDYDTQDKEGAPLAAMEVRPVTISGALNSWTNYGHSHDQHSLSGKDLSFTEANPVVLGDGLPLNKDVKGQVEGSQISWGGGFDVGCDGDVNSFNLHKNYYEAAYTNQRHLSLFTEGLKICTETFTDLELFQTVKYIQTDELDDSDMINPRYEGKYLVGGQTLMIRGHHYVEVLDLYRSFIEEAGDTKVVGGSGSGSSGSAGGGVGGGGTGGGGLGDIDGQIPQNGSGDGESLDDIKDSIGNETNTGNKPTDSVPSYKDKIDKDTGQQPNFDVSEGSPIDTVGNKFDKIVDDAEKIFKESGSKYKSPEFVKKYGENGDFLDSLMKEFSRAKDLLDMCKLLGGLELFALKKIKLELPQILKDLEERANWLDKQMADMDRMINDLIRRGELPKTFVSAPKGKLDCMQHTTNSINDAIEDKLPDMCVDRLVWDRLNLPKLKLGQLLKRINDFLRDLLCNLGKELDSALTGKGSGSGAKNLIDAIKTTATSAGTESKDFIDSVKDFGGKYG